MIKAASLLLALVAVLAGALALPGLTTPVRANSQVQIRDEANVLSAADRQNITAAAQRAPFAVTVWTTTAYTNKTLFINAVDALVGNDAVVLGVNTLHGFGFTHIAARANTGLTTAENGQAESLANSNFNNEHWGAGFVAAINSLTAVVGPAPANNAPLPQPASTSGPGLGGLGLLFCLLPIIVIVGLAIFLRNRVMGNRGGVTPAINPNYYPPQTGYGPGVNPNYPPPGYGPGYGNPAPGSGIGGNIVSGGIGALGGGVIGYELGRHAGDNQGQQGGNFAPDFGNSGGGGIVDSPSGGPGPDFGAGA